MDENSIKIIGKLVSIGITTGTPDDALNPSISAIISIKDRVIEGDYLVSEQQYIDVNLDEKQALFLSKYLFKTVSVMITPVLRPELIVHDNHGWTEENK